MLLILEYQFPRRYIRDCRQITFVTFNGFCPLSKHPTPPPTTTTTSPLFLTDNIKVDRIPAKIKCKIHAPFVLTNFCKTQLARYLVLTPTGPNSVSKFYLQIADKKLSATVFPLLVREARTMCSGRKKSNISVILRFFSRRGGLCF